VRQKEDDSVTEMNRFTEDFISYDPIYSALSTCEEDWLFHKLGPRDKRFLAANDLITTESVSGVLSRLLKLSTYCSHINAP